MKIRAIRAAEVGLFGDAVALEGLSGSLDVLAGPNELGKSTLFRALSLLISEKHTSTAKAIQSLRPNSGGAPLIEADLEVEGRTWRLRKRYLAQRQAELVDLGSGEVWRGADAEGRVEALLRAGGRGELRGLVWVAQAESFALPRGDGELGSALAALIEQEAAATTGLSRVRRVREMVAEQLGQLMTMRGPKVGSELARAIEARTEIRNRLEAARARAVAMETRISELADLRDERERITTPALAEAASAELARLRKELGEAHTARQRKQTADAQVQAQQLQRDGAAATLERFDRQAAELTRCEDELHRLKAELAALEPKLDAANAELAVARAGRKTIAAQIAEQRRVLAQLEVHELEQKIASVRSASARVAALEDRIKAYAVDDTSMEAARRAVAQLDVLDARIATGSPRVSVRYQADASGRVHAAGRALGEGESVLVERRLELQVDGVGTIVIEPAQAHSEDLIARRDGERQRLSALLSRLGTADVPAAEAALAERRSLEGERAELAAELRAMAPAGIAPLEQAAQAARQRCAGCEVADHVDRSDSEHRLSQLERELAAIDGDIAHRAAAAHRLDSERTRMLATCKVLEERLAVRPAQTQGADAERMHLAGAVDAAEIALAAAVREASAWAMAVPTAEANAALERRIADAETGLRAHQARRHEVERAIADREGALRRDGEDGTGGDIAGLEEQLAAAEARVSDLELDVEALSLLAARLDETAATHRQQVLRPIVERLEPTLQRLHAGARVALDGPMLIARLERDVGSHTLQQLSDGTREQIAVLVRLAYAGLLADRGAAMPLVLDDALAFSDDARFAAMLTLLSEASVRHQVIALSCREQAIADVAGRIGANLLRIAPWQVQDQTSAGRTGRTRSSAERKAS